MKEIKNKEVVIEQLTKMLMQFDKDFNEYNTDVYLYYNEETKTAELDTFVYVGNSWRDDDHVTIYTDSQHYDDIYEHMMDYFEENVSDALDMDIVDIEKAVSEWLDIDIDDVDVCDIAKWVKEFHSEKMHEYYNDRFIDENRSDYVEHAKMIIERFEEG